MVHVTGTGAGSEEPKPWSRFEDVRTESTGAKGYLPPRTVNCLTKEKGFVRPTVIQAHFWPVACAEQDLIGIAKTGSGKSLAPPALRP